MFVGKKNVRKIASCFISLALFLVIGGPWAVLQTVAWTKMMVDYSRGASLTEAVTKTFDGEHPCGLCKKISKVRQGEQKSPLVILQTKKEGPFLAVQTFRLAEPASIPVGHLSLLIPAYPDTQFRPPAPVPKA
ncbi:MAG: hypothetical protein EBS49_07260 [Verrucomicrobia bacterium]|nr:hypothetical protein [Verrucomicrobiota bacterium]